MCPCQSPAMQRDTHREAAVADPLFWAKATATGCSCSKPPAEAARNNTSEITLPVGVAGLKCCARSCMHSQETVHSIQVFCLTKCDAQSFRAWQAIKVVGYAYTHPVCAGVAVPGGELLYCSGSLGAWMLCCGPVHCGHSCANQGSWRITMKLSPHPCVCQACTQ